MSEQRPPNPSHDADDLTVDQMIERVRRWLFGVTADEHSPDRDGSPGAAN